MKHLIVEFMQAASIALGIDRWQEAKWNSLNDKAENKKKSAKIRKSKWLNEK